MGSWPGIGQRGAGWLESQRFEDGVLAVAGDGDSGAVVEEEEVAVFADPAFDVAFVDEMGLVAADETIGGQEGFVFVHWLGYQYLIAVVQKEIAIVVVGFATDDLPGVEEPGFFLGGKGYPVFFFVLLLVEQLEKVVELQVLLFLGEADGGFVDGGLELVGIDRFEQVVDGGEFYGLDAVLVMRGDEDDFEGRRRQLLQ